MIRNTCLETPTQFQRIVENCPGMLFRYVLHPDGAVDITYVGPQVRELFNVHPEEVLDDALALYKNVHPDDVSKFSEALTFSAETMKPLDVVCRVVLARGNIRWIKAMARAERCSNSDTVLDGVVVDISDQKRLETEKEIQLAIIENTSDFIGTCDVSGEITYLNQAMIKLNKSNSGNTIERTHINQFHPPASSEIIFSQAQPVATEHGVWIGETELSDAEGNKFPVSQAIIAHKNREGEVEQFSTICRNISREKSVEHALEEARMRLQQVTENVPCMIYQNIYKTDGEFLETVFVNSRSKELYGVEPKDVLTAREDMTKWIHPDDLPNYSKNILSSIKTLQPFTVEYRVIPPECGTRWHQTTGHPRLLENDCVSVVGISTDITGQKTAELALQEAQKRFHRVAENVPGMIYRALVNSDGSCDISYVSSQCRELFEVEPEDALGNAENLFKHIHPDDILETQKVIDQSTAEFSKFFTEYRVLLPKKGLCWRQSIGQPARTAEGNMIWDCVTIDITDRKNSELRLKTANEQLTKATRMKDEFLANMSHELRTPLSAILGMNEGLQKGYFGSVSGEQAESFKVIQDSGEHLLELINEILDLAKIESGSITLDLSNIDVAKLCDSAIQLVAQQADRKNITVNSSVSAALPNLEADEMRIRQILVNLLSNAVKFTNEGGEVTLAAERIAATDETNSNSLRFSVRDTGIGIEKYNLKTVFEPFTQVQTSLNRDYGGTGLGLALVKQYAELHSGSVGVNSKVGDGSYFYVDLPFVQSNKPFNEVTTDLNEQITPNLQIAKPTNSRNSDPLVLLAEDNKSVALSTTRYLEKSGYRVHRVADGEASVIAAQELSPDIILMDIQMPGVDGLEAIKIIKKIDSLMKTPVVALTGLAMQGDSIRCFEAGADHYLSKPYRMQELVRLIEQALLSEAKAGTVS